MTSTGIVRTAVFALALVAAASPAAAETHSGTWRAKLQEDQDIFRNGSGAQLKVVVTVCIDAANSRGITLHKKTDNSIGVTFVLLKDQACHTHATTLANGAWLAIHPRESAPTDVTGTYQVSW